MMLHEELRQAREEIGMTQAQLAARAGIPRNQVVRAERGENITLDTLRKIAAHLPLEKLTLLEKVHLDLDILPLPEKVYSHSMQTLMYMIRGMISALQSATAASEAMHAARQAQPFPGAIEEIDDVAFLQSMEDVFNQIQTRIQEQRTG